MQKFIVSRDDSIYEAWPDVVLCNSGRMICVFSECDHHGNRNNARIAYVTSDNRGRTWSAKRYLTEKAVRVPKNMGPYYNCARISKLSDGRIAVVCDLIKGAHENAVENTENHLWFSSDEGRTWDGPIMTPVHGIVPERLYELKSGRWLLAAHHMHPETGKLTEYLWYSDDKGKTWSERICLAMDARYDLCEVGLVEVEPNVVVGFLRENSGRGWDCFKAISRDGGETWEGVYNVPIPGCHRPTVGLLQDGRLLVTYRYLQGGLPGWGRTTQNVMGALMAPDMITEPERNKQCVRIFPLDYDRNAKADLGYTGWVQFEDGEIYIVNYIVDDAPKAQIRGYSLRVDELYIEN